MMGKNPFLFLDKFDSAIAAGSLNGTFANIGGVRTVTDTGNKIATSLGALSFATGATVNDGIWWDTLPRVPGRLLLSTITPANVSQKEQVGWDNNKSGAIGYYIQLDTSSRIFSIGGALLGLYTVAAHKLAVILRATGFFTLIKGGAYSNWTLLWPSNIGSLTPLSPAIIAISTTAIFTADNVCVPSMTWLPIPIATDNFSSVIQTDGLGNPEHNGSAGLVWTDIGTWGVSANAASCSSLSGGLGIRYVTTSSPNAIVDVVPTRSAGNVGGIARYVDSNNYLRFYYEGTNAVCEQIVAGNPSTLRTGAVSFVAGGILRLILEDATTARLYYNETGVGAVFTVPSSTNTNHGIYTTNTGNTLKRFVVWPRGTGNEYIGLDEVNP